MNRRHSRFDPVAALNELAPLIGDTPLLRIDYQFDDQPRYLFAKHEQKNMTGSTKDRVVLHVLRHAYRCGALRAGHTISDVARGNTALSLAAIGRALRHPVRLFVPDSVPADQLDALRAYGADVVVFPAAAGVDGGLDLLGSFTAERNDVLSCLVEHGVILRLVRPNRKRVRRRPRRLAATGEADASQSLDQPTGLPGVGRCHGRHAFGEDFAVTSRRIAEEPAHVQV